MADLINSYLQRRGYFTCSKNNHLASSLCEKRDEIDRFLINYIKFIRSLSTQLPNFKCLARLSTLNYRILKYASNYCQIPAEFFDQSLFFFNTADVLEPNLDRDDVDRTIADRLTDFSNDYCSSRDLKDIFSNFNRVAAGETWPTPESVEDVEKDHPSRTGLKIEQFFNETYNKHKISQSILCYKFEQKICGRILSADVSKSRDTFALGADDGRISVFRRHRPASQHWTGHSEAVYALRLLLRDNYVVSASADQTVRLWDLDGQKADGNPYFQYYGHTGQVFCLDVHGTEQLFATGSADHKVCLFDFEQLTPVRLMSYHSAAVHCVKFCSCLTNGNKSSLVTAAADRKICLWSSELACPVRVYNDTIHHYPTLLSYHPTKNILIVGSYNRKLTLIDVRTDRTLQTLDLDHVIPYQLDFDKSKAGHWSLMYVGGVSVVRRLNTVKRLRMSFGSVVTDEPASGGGDETTTGHDAVKLIKSGLDFDIEQQRRTDDDEDDGDLCCQAIAARDPDFEYTSVVLA